MTTISTSSERLLETMKYRVNRLKSFSEKWPLDNVRPADLAETGFFYLQSDDAVQCAFCKIVMKRWFEGQKPSREHARRSPQCPFLAAGGEQTRSPPIVRKEPVSEERSPVVRIPFPKYPRMADEKKRLDTFRNWSKLTLAPKQLAECGFYYTTIADIVTCYACGGSLGNWKVTGNDPWMEHEMFFPTCPFLRLTTSSGGKRTSRQEKREGKLSSSHDSTASPHSNRVVHREVVEQACDIFPKSLVEKTVFERTSKGLPNLSSLQELCDEILETKKRESESTSIEAALGAVVTETASRTPLPPGAASALPACPRIDESARRKKKARETTRSRETAEEEILLCKICMDGEKGITLQPCGHCPACPRCSERLEKCPLCRETIVDKIRTYL